MIDAKVTGQLFDVNLDFSDRMREVSQIMERAIQLNFSSGGRLPSRRYFPTIDGAIPWLPLKRPRPGGGPLNKTGKFMRSVESDSTATSATVMAGKKGLSWDPQVPWVHQRGAGRVPARPYMLLTDADMDEIQDTLMEDFIIRTNI